MAWSIVGPSKSGKNMLIKYHPYRITLHHNLLANSATRNPQIANDDARSATELTVDMRNNLCGSSAPEPWWPGAPGPTW